MSVFLNYLEDDSYYADHLSSPASSTFVLSMSKEAMGIFWRVN